MPLSPEDRAFIEILLDKQRRNLRVLQLQSAEYGAGETPLHLINSINNVQREIGKYEAQLSDDSIDLPQLTPNVNHNTQSSRKILENVCRLLDFRIIKIHFDLYQDDLLVAVIEVDSFQARLPSKFPIVVITTADEIDEAVMKLDHLSNKLDFHVTFGLVLAPFDTAHAEPLQRIINRQIRASMKVDWIVLGRRLLDVLPIAPSPKALLLGEILREIELTRLNPFFAGGANGGDSMFFGREGELKNIAENIEHTSVAIVCGRRIGKTSMLNRLHQVVLPKRKYACWYLNCQTVSDYQSFRAAMAKDWNQPQLAFDPADPNSFALVATDLTPTSGKSPVFLLDEIDSLLRFDAGSSYPLFKQLRALSAAGAARFVVTGERFVQDNLSDADSPMFNFFGMKLRLSFLELAATQKLIREPLDDLQVQLEEPLALVDRIYRATSGHPYLVQQCCQLLVERISKRSDRIIRNDDLDHVLDDRYYQQEYFLTVWGQAQPLAKIITLLLPEASASLGELRRLLKDSGFEPPLKELMAALDILDLYSVVAKQGTNYTFLARMFPEMCRRAYGDDLPLQVELIGEDYRCGK